MRKLTPHLLSAVFIIIFFQGVRAHDTPNELSNIRSGAYINESIGANDLFLPLLVKNSPCNPTNPSWKILVLVYEETDLYYTDTNGVDRHFYASLTQAEKDKINAQSTRFVLEDIPALNNCNMKPTITIRYPNDPLTNLSPMGCSDYAPSPDDVADQRDPFFDSVITIWDGSGIDLNTGNTLSIQGCAWAWPMGTSQLYDAIFADFVTIYNSDSRNVFKHEWGHSIVFYFYAAGTSPKPPVDNHINDTTNQYVNCLTGQLYLLLDETDTNPIPNSIYNNHSGFTHDYFSGFTATIDQPSRCLGITSNAWASGGPVSRGSVILEPTLSRWPNSGDNFALDAIHYSP